MRRSGLKIMVSLVSLIKPMTGYMVASFLLGIGGNLCAIAIPTLGAFLLLTFMGEAPMEISTTLLIVGILACALLRGGLRYGEQTLGHFIAFKVLAIIRSKVFFTLRKLCPAKLESKNKGDLIGLITNDIELLEVFYAHTIAPLIIALIVSGFITGVLFFINVIVGLMALVFFVLVGVILPLFFASFARKEGMEFRNKMGELNNYFLESLRGIGETLQFDELENRSQEISKSTRELNEYREKLQKQETYVSGVAAVCILLASGMMVILTTALSLSFFQVVMATVIMASSFGPVLALAQLTGTLSQTLASGERVLALLEEEPEIVEVYHGKEVEFEQISGKGIDFAYDEKKVLNQVSLTVEKGNVVAISGPSGCGKSTLLKLFMRFWDVKEGRVSISQVNIKEIPTDNLRDMESFMTQDTQLFHLSIEDNIKVGKLDATHEEVEKAAKKASLHSFISTLPKGYDTLVGELGSTLSGGEKQRIGLARAFLHDGALLLLDEPTSNLDSLNEGIILKALTQLGEEKAVVLVTHRESTTGIADKHIKMS